MKKYSFLFSLFVIFLLILCVFVSFISAKTDYHITYGGGVSSLLHISNEHIVMNDNGDMIYAMIGYDGDSSYVNMWIDFTGTTPSLMKPIRQTTSETGTVAITRDSDFNIHAVYTEKGGDNRYYLFYKFFDSSIGSWDIEPTLQGLNITSTGYDTSVSMDIKIDTDDNIHLITNEMHVGTTISELVYHRYNSILGTWDLNIGIESESTTMHIYQYPSLALDSNNNIYCTYSKNQDTRWGSVFFDTWLIKSTNGGTSWSSPNQLINKTYSQTVYSNKLIIDNNDILHYTTSENFSNVDEWKVRYYKSTNYGSSFNSGVNISDENTQQSQCSVTKDVNNILYFTWAELDLIGDPLENVDIFGKKLENGVWGNKISIINKDDSYQAWLTLVYSNTYNQYADSGVIGIYEDRANANYDIRVLTLSYDDFSGGSTMFKWDFIPEKDPYLIFDSMTLRQTTYEQHAYWNRIVNATDVFIFYPEFYWTVGVKDTVFTIPSDFGIGEWTLETYVTDDYFNPPDWGNDTHYDKKFNVDTSGLNYYISASKYYVQIPDTIDILFSAKSGEHYILELWHYNYGLLTNITIPVVGVDQDYYVANAFLIDQGGIHHIKLVNGSDLVNLAITDGIYASEYPEMPTYTTNLKSSYSVDREHTITIYSDSAEQYKYEFLNPYDEVILTGLYAGARGHSIQITFDTIADDYSLYIYDADGTRTDANTYYETFNVVKHSIITEDNVELYIGVVIVVMFAFMGLGIAIKGHVEPMPTTLVFSIIGSLIATVMELLPVYFIFILGILLIAWIVTKLMPS